MASLAYRARDAHAVIDEQRGAVDGEGGDEIQPAHRQVDLDAARGLLLRLQGEQGELGCTLLVEIPDEKKRDELLRAWRELPAHLYVRLDNGDKCYARFDKRQIGDDRLSAVQYLKFATGGRAPVAVGSDLSFLRVEAVLDDKQRRTLAADLGG